MSATTPAWPGSGPISQLYLSYLRKFPTVRGKLGLGRAFADHVMPTLRITGDNGARFELDPKDWISWLIARDGSYESSSLRNATEILTASGGGTVLDIGAAWGLYTCTLGVLPGVDVVAVEPTARSFERLTHNVAINGVRAKLFNMALSQAPEIVPMSFDVGGNDLTARVVRDGGRFASAVTATTVLKIAGARSIRLLKIDVEGYEWPILEAFPWGDLSPEWMIIELYGQYLAERGMTRADAVRFLADRGYAERESHDDNTFFERV